MVDRQEASDLRVFQREIEDSSRSCQRSVQKVRGFPERATENEQQDLKSLFLRFTGEVAANAGLGMEGYCVEDDAGVRSFHELSRIVFAESLDQVITFHFPTINRFLKLSFLPKSIDRFFRKVVSENWKIRRNDTSPRNDFLQLMIDMEKTRGAIDEENVAAYAVFLYLDGTKTTSITLNFIGDELAVNPEIQEKLRKEVRSTIEKHGGLTFEVLKDMTYMNQVISESQRLHSAVGILQKMCTKELELQGSDGLTYCINLVPTWTYPFPVCIPIQSTVPVRMFSTRNDERKQTIEKMAYLPFGEGPRICVGMRMALLQVKICLATLLNIYKLEFSPRMQLPLKMSPHYLISEPIGGNWVYISKL